jgi:hypothetical protein
MKGRIVERALFLIGQQNTGKSTQMRSMFRDRRFGTAGKIPLKNGPRKVHLSGERTLLLRKNSPHEKGEDLKTYLDSIDGDMGVGRWCLASSLHPHKSGDTPAAPEMIAGFKRRFRPERTRVCILSPIQNGVILDEGLTATLRKRLHAIGSEVFMIDATRETANGLILADFFDFT